MGAIMFVVLSINFIGVPTASSCSGSIDYLLPAWMDELLEVAMECLRVGGAHI